MTEPAAIHPHLTPAAMREVLQSAGYRVEDLKSRDGGPVLRSATGGLAFEVLFANPLPDQAGAFADATFQAAFQVHGELPLTLVNQWNVSRRFGRLNLLQNLLLLDMDVVGLGGVSVGNLRAQAEIWDRLVSQLIAYLRDELPKIAPRAEPAVDEQAEPAVDEQAEPAVDEPAEPAVDEPAEPAVQHSSDAA